MRLKTKAVFRKRGITVSDAAPVSLDKDAQPNPRQSLDVNSAAEGRAICLAAVTGFLALIPLTGLSLGTVPSVLISLGVAAIAAWFTHSIVRHRIPQYLISWDEEDVTLYRGESEIGTKKWSELISVDWAPLLNLRLTFRSGQEWVIPREWAGSSTDAQRDLRAHLLSRDPKVDALTPNRSVPIGRILEGLGVGRVVAGSWILAVFVLAIPILVPDRGSAAYIAATAAIAIALTVSILAIRHSVLNGSWARVLVSDEVMRALGREIRWNQVESVDWSGPARDRLMLRAAGRTWRINLGEFLEGAALKESIRQHPAVQAVWERQLILDSPVKMPWLKWFVEDQSVVSLNLNFFLGLVVVGVVTHGLPLWILASIPIAVWGVWQLIRRPFLGLMTVDGFVCRPLRRFIRFDEVRSVQIEPVGGDIVIAAQDHILKIPSSWEGVGRVEAILRARVSADAFEDGDDFPEKGDGDETLG